LGTSAPGADGGGMTVPGATDGGAGGRTRGIGEPCGTGFAGTNGAGCAAAVEATTMAPSSITAVTNHLRARVVDAVSRPDCGPTSPWFNFFPSVPRGPEGRPARRSVKRSSHASNWLGPLTLFPMFRVNFFEIKS
jgi:hypothetical protein